MPSRSDQRLALTGASCSAAACSVHASSRQPTATLAPGPSPAQRERGEKGQELAQRIERLAGGGDNLGDQGLVVLAGYEAGFVSGWSQVDAALQHLVEEPVEAVAVTLHHVAIARRDLGGKVDAEH